VAIGSDRCHELAALFSSGDAPYYQAVPLDFRDPEHASRQIQEAVREKPVRAIVSTDDHTTAIAARAAVALGLATNPVRAVEAARNKRLLRERLAAAGVPPPRHQSFSIDADPARIEVGLPCVVKPTFLSASRGVIRADDRPGFQKAFARVAALLRVPEVAAKGGPAAREILVEEFVPGIEVALEGLLVGGRLEVLALFDKPDPLAGPFFGETLYVTPSRLPAALQSALFDVSAQAAAALGLREGPVHAELRIPPGGGPVVIELAARSIGGLCSRTLRFGAGIPLEELILAHALGRDVRPLGLARERAAAGVMMLPIPAGGLLREVRGQNAAAAVPGIEGIEITMPLGSELIPLPEGASYLGFVFARADSPDQVEAAL